MPKQAFTCGCLQPAGAAHTNVSWTNDQTVRKSWLILVKFYAIFGIGSQRELQNMTEFFNINPPKEDTDMFSDA